MLMRDRALPPRFVLHSGRFPSETIQLFKESEKAACFLVFLFTEGCWNTETGRDTTTYRDSALIWVKLCLLLAQRGTFSSLIINIKICEFKLLLHKVGISLVGVLF